MTQPIGSGYPDYGRQVAQADVLIMEASSAIAGLTNFGPFFVGNAPYLDVHLNPLGASSQATFDFFRDAAMTTSLSSDGITVNANGDGRVCIPVSGPWVYVTVEMNAYPNTPFLTVMAVGQPASHVGQDGLEGILFSTFNLAIGAGVVVNLDANIVRAGTATFSGVVGSATWSMEVFARNMGGGQFFLFDVNQVIGRRPFTFTVPPAPLRVTVRNTGAASSYNLGITMRPLHAGS